MKLTIVTPEKIIFTGDVENIKVPGEKGEFEILNRHAPIISSLNAGKVTYRIDGNNEESVNIKSGFVEAAQNNVTLCVETESEKK